MSEQENDQQLDQEGERDEAIQEPGADASNQGTDQSDQQGGDESGDSDSEEGEADAGAGSESESSDDEVGDESGDQESHEDTDPEAEQLAAALAAATASSQQPAVPVNDAGAPVAVAALAAAVAPVVSDVPEQAPEAAPATRAPSVTTSKPVPVKVDVAAQQAEIKLQNIRDRLAGYAEAMAPNKVLTASVGKDQQKSLWEAIQQTLRLEGAEFIKGYGMLLDFFAEYRTSLFNDKYIYRFFAEAALSSADRKNFSRLLNLLVATADKATRRLGLEQVDLNRTLADIRDTAVQQRIAEFYQI